MYLLVTNVFLEGISISPRIVDIITYRSLKCFEVVDDYVDDVHFFKIFLGGVIWLMNLSQYVLFAVARTYSAPALNTSLSISLM